MTFIIPIMSLRALPLLVMSEIDSTDFASPVFTGTGEFQLRDIHVIAKVEVQNGIVRKIDFTSGSGEQLPAVKDIENQLKGHLLSKALEVRAWNADEFKDKHSRSAVEEAVLEAFHRAIEAYLDEM